MSLTQIQKIQLNQQVDRILHAPGNQPAGRGQLEMAFVLDTSCDKESIKSTLTDAVTSLKAHDKIFQNVRSNVVFWKKDGITTQVMPMSFIQMGKPFTEEYEDNWKQEEDNIPVLDELCAYLKLYHARSKCILVMTEGNYRIIDKSKTAESLNPFLKYKLLIMTPEQYIKGNTIFMEMIR